MDREIKTQRDNKKLHNDGALFIFHKCNRDGDVKFWRCENERSLGCRARIHTALNDTVMNTIGQHSCNPSAANVVTQQIISGIKKRAAETMEPPATIRAHVLQQVPTPVLATMPNKFAIKKVIRRVRHEINAPPAVPNSIDELIIPDRYKYYHRTDTNQELFLLADSGVYMEEGRNGNQRMLIFGRQSFSTWSDNMKTVYGDGTFSISPNNFFQVYCIMARRDKWVFPVLFCLLTSKTQETYVRMFRTITEIWPNFSPDSMSLDFEAAVIGAVKTVFPNCSIYLCFFHLVKNMKKKVSQLGMTQRYNMDAEFSLKCRLITSIAFLPIDHITHGILALENVVGEELLPILDWFVDTYTGRLRFNGTRTQPLFAPEMWSVHERTLRDEDRTNNFCEASHRRLQQAFSCDHPTIWAFIDTLRKEQKLVDANVAQFVAGHDPPKKVKRYRDADKRILSIVRRYLEQTAQHQYPDHQLNLDHQYAQNAITPQTIIDFLTGISNNYHMNQ